MFQLKTLSGVVVVAANVLVGMISGVAGFEGAVDVLAKEDGVYEDQTNIPKKRAKTNEQRKVMRRTMTEVLHDCCVGFS